MPDDHDDLTGVSAFAYEVGHLDRTPRAGWLMAGVKHPQTVAAHSHRVSVLAYVIAAQEGADADRACSLGAFHDVPETRTGDLSSMSKRYLTGVDPAVVAEDQTQGLPPALAIHVIELVGEFEAAKSEHATPEARCARDADKLECLLMAREYQREGYGEVQPWIDTMAAAVATETGKRLADLAQHQEPDAWWNATVASYGEATRQGG